MNEWRVWCAGCTSRRGLREVEGARDGEPALAALPGRADRRGQSDEVEAAGRGTSDDYEPLPVASAAAGGTPVSPSSRPSARCGAVSLDGHSPVGIESRS